ncbi:hypothetical protein ABIA38_000290 [Embleya sp. AB8]
MFPRYRSRTRFGRHGVACGVVSVAWPGCPQAPDGLGWLARAGLAAVSCRWPGRVVLKRRTGWVGWPGRVWLRCRVGGLAGLSSSAGRAGFGRPGGFGCGVVSAAGLGCPQTPDRLGWLPRAVRLRRRVGGLAGLSSNAGRAGFGRPGRVWLRCHVGGLVGLSSSAGSAGLVAPGGSVAVSCRWPVRVVLRRRTGWVWPPRAGLAAVSCRQPGWVVLKRRTGWVGCSEWFGCGVGLGWVGCGGLVRRLGGRRGWWAWWWVRPLRRRRGRLRLGLGAFGRPGPRSRR